eukprot:SAG22_NODE_1056_length_5777_cov_137.240402_8_plen_91_part_00
MPDGTEEHTADRIFDLFKDLLDSANELPFWLLDQTQAEHELKDMLLSIEGFLGDHGEKGAERSLRLRSAVTQPYTRQRTPTGAGTDASGL